MIRSAGLLGYALGAVAVFAAALLVIGPVRDAGSLVAPALWTITIVIPLAYLVARRDASSMHRLRNATSALAAGDSNARPPLSGPPDVADVAAAVHRLAERLAVHDAAIATADTLLTALVDSLNEAVMVVDSGERVIRINAAARDLFGLHEAVPFVAGKLPRARALHRTLNSALGGTAVGPLEIEVRERQISLAGRPLAGGGAVLAALDLTPLRKLEAVRRDFVANVSHELRTPLTVIHGFAETLVAEDVDPDARREFAGMIRSNTARMQRIVDDLLDLSRIESGGWVPDPTEVHVRPLATEVLANVEAGASQKGLSLTIDIAPDAASVYADRIALSQTLTNLVENAIRHTDAGGVTVFAAASSDAGVWVGVRDTGEGIPAGHLPRIFERFYRADPGRSRQSGGTGLGLAIVKHLAEAHGGTVVAESEVGRGTTVRAFFPMAGTG